MIMIGGGIHRKIAAENIAMIAVRFTADKIYSQEEIEEIGFAAMKKADESGEVQGSEDRARANIF